MINDIMKTFLSSKPNLKILQIVDYDNTSYLIAATEDMKKIPMYPYYIMNKTTGKVEDFNNMIEPNKFFEACKKRTIYSIK